MSESSEIVTSVVFIYSIDFYELLDSSKHKEKFCEQRSSIFYQCFSLCKCMRT